MVDQKSYNGNHVCLHVVQSGESLSKIANYYQLPQWQAIWFFNTKVQQVYMGDDPDIIRSGQRLFIPRSPQGYDRLLKKIYLLKVNIECFGDQEKIFLERLWNEHQAEKVLFDLAGSIATTIATFGFKSVEAAKAAKVAKETVGQGRIAAQYLAEKKVRDLAKGMKSSLFEKFTEWLSSQADSGRTRKTGVETSVFSTSHKTAVTGKKAWAAIQSFSLQGGKAFLDVADIALDYLNPSTVANIILLAAVGETTEDTYKNQKDKVSKTVKAQANNLQKKIDDLARERETVYPKSGSFVGNYMLFPPMHISGV